MCLSLDFQDEELQFRQDIWHNRVALLISELDKPFVSDSLRINCEQIRLWLEEGQELEIVKVLKYERLSEIVEDIDNITKALRACNSLLDFEVIDRQENAGLIDISHLIVSARHRFALDSKTKIHVKGGAVAFLKSLRNRRDDHDVEMEPLGDE